MFSIKGQIQIFKKHLNCCLESPSKFNSAKLAPWYRVKRHNTCVVGVVGFVPTCDVGNAPTGTAEGMVCVHVTIGSCPGRWVVIFTTLRPSSVNISLN